MWTEVKPDYRTVWYNAKQLAQIARSATALTGVRVCGTWLQDYGTWHRANGGYGFNVATKLRKYEISDADIEALLRDYALPSAESTQEAKP